MNQIETPAQSFTFNIDMLGVVRNKIEIANRRLEKAGIEERFDFLVTGTEELIDEHGLVSSIEVTGVVNHPQVAFKGYEFVARVIIEDGGTILRTVPGQDVGDWGRPESHRCDYCNQSRSRKQSYIVRNTETRELLQVGSNCLSLFLGVDLSGLWFLERFSFEEFEEMRKAASEEYYNRAPSSRTDITYTVDMVIRMGLILSDMGRSFVSKAASQKAREEERFLEATSEKFFGTLSDLHPFMSTKDSRERMQAAQAVVEASKALPESDVQEVLEAAKTLYGGDYATNCQVLANSTSISPSSVGILLSLIMVNHRNKTKELEKKAAPKATGFLEGEEKERVEFTGTLTRYSHSENDWGTTTIVTFITDDGKVVKWFASDYKEFEEGRVSVKATIKGHDNFNGEDQTIVTRCKVTNI